MIRLSVEQKARVIGLVEGGYVFNAGTFKVNAIKKT